MAACKSKKPSLSGEDPVDVEDFIDFFPDAKLPYKFADTSLLKKDNDSLLISHKVFTQIVPDSILARTFGKNSKLKIYPMARVKGKTETYLFVKVIGGDKRAAYALGFNKDDEFLDGLSILQLDGTSATQQTADIDNRFVLSKKITRKNGDGSTSDGSDQYVLNNDARSFMLILTEALDDKVTELINPIDTVSRKQKFTADYGSGQMNLVSFRDGRKTDKLRFFIHFEKNKGDCTGELKGEARMKTATVAEYREPGDPCALEFTFTSSAVSIKEVGGCGSRRGLRCSFNGVYARKKEAKPKAVMTSKKTSGK
ncbi:MAG: hypothetical protein ABIR18_06935 [Chitinophagaceae bacterium]